MGFFRNAGGTPDSSHARWKNEEEYMEARRSYIQYLVEVDIQFVEIAAKKLIS
ncbi:hypothetical protein I6G76_02175 (plasmid) [Bacillus cereus]|uniref:hypothetical protein n=1 Tax=Bacillus cereus TaxID=1396 RepID=UPI0003226A9F|nr:hypothetical protein [Bacillus cereus]QQA19100.1 hypothetical protein I6G76_02175 [Bacillus cereus]